MGIKIFLYVTMILPILMIILGVIIWGKQCTKLLLNYKIIVINQEDVKKYTKYVGIMYIILGVTILPVIFFGIIDNRNLGQNVIARLVWLLGFYIVVIINSKMKKKLKL